MQVPLPTFFSKFKNLITDVFGACSYDYDKTEELAIIPKIALQNDFNLLATSNFSPHHIWGAGELPASVKHASGQHFQKLIILSEFESCDKGLEVLGAELNCRYC